MLGNLIKNAKPPSGDKKRNTHEWSHPAQFEVRFHTELLKQNLKAFLDCFDNKVGCVL